MNKFEERLQWFLERVGKRVYRGSVSCDCDICGHVEERGIFISNEMHAHYLNDIEAEFSAEGHELKYVDEPVKMNKKDRLKLLEEAQTLSSELYDLSCKARKIVKKLEETEFTVEEEAEVALGLISALTTYEH